MDQNSDKKILFHDSRHNHNSKPNIVKWVGLDDNVTKASLDLAFASLDPVTTWLQNPNDMTAEMEISFFKFSKKVFRTDP